MPKGKILTEPVSLEEAIGYSLSDGIFVVQDIAEKVAKELSPKQFLESFFCKWNRRIEAGKKATLYMNGKVQSACTKKRSLGDLFAILKSYYPDIEFLEVKKIINDLLEEKIISTWICGTIHKRVFFYTPRGIYYKNQLDQRDEYGWFWKDHLNK